MFEKFKRVFWIVFIFIILFVVITFIFALLYYNNNNPQIAYSNDPNTIKLSDCLYFSSITFSSVGYGEIYPTQFWGRLFASIEGYLGIVYTVLFSGFLIHAIFDITIEELTGIAKKHFDISKKFECYPKKEEYEVVPIRQLKPGKFEINFSESEALWCSCVIHVESKQNWEWIAKKGRKLNVNINAKGIKKIKLELKDESKQRFDNNNTEFNIENNFRLSKSLLELNNNKSKWKAVSEICFVVHKDDVIDNIGYFEVDKISISK